MKPLPPIKDSISNILKIPEDLTVYKKVVDKQATIKNIHKQYLNSVDYLVRKNPWIPRDILLVRDNKSSKGFKRVNFDKDNLPTGIHESLSLLKKLQKNYIRCKTMYFHWAYELCFVKNIENETGKTSHLDYSLQDFINVSEKLLVVKLPLNYKIELTKIYNEILERLALQEEDTGPFWRYRVQDCHDSQRWSLFLGKGLFMLENLKNIKQ